MSNINMNRTIDQLLKRIVLSKDDSWKADYALEYILYEYGEYEIVSAISGMSRREQIKIANKLSELKDVAFHSGFALKLKGIERGIESWCLRNFWGHKWLSYVAYLFACAIAWGLSKVFSFSANEIIFFAGTGLFVVLKTSFHEISRQNELIIQKITKSELEVAKAELKTALQERGWLGSDS